jgi:signal transduction histidine kinase
MYDMENGFWKYDIAADEYYFSPGITRIFNLERQDMKTHDAFLERIHPADVDSYASRFDEKIKTSRDFTLSYRIALEDGTVKDAEEHVEFLFDKDGKATSYYGIVSDISCFIKLRHEGQDAYSLINSVLRTLPNLIFVKNIDAGFRFTFVNDNFASFYGFSPAEIIGKYDKDISTPEQASACYVTDNQASSHDINAPLVSVEEIPVSPKSVKYMQTIKFAHVINGTNYLICSAMDITDLVKARQKAEESDKLKTAFLRTISHEIRTPMNSIMGYSQLITDLKYKNEVESLCEKIQDNGSQLLSLMTNIVYLARLETMNGMPAYENIDLESLFVSLKNHYERKAHAKGLDLIYAPHCECCNIYSNKEGITEMLRNFLDNSIKFTEKGSITMGYEVECNNLRLWVQDTGIGIDNKKKKSVFKRFVKLNDFTPGTGIGLYISQKIAKAMKGKISIDTKIGKGTYVWADLPLEVVKKATCDK